MFPKALVKNKTKRIQQLTNVDFNLSFMSLESGVFPPPHQLSKRGGTVSQFCFGFNKLETFKIHSSLFLPLDSIASFNREIISQQEGIGFLIEAETKLY